MLTPFAIGTEAEGIRCGLCQRSQPPFAKAVAYGSYEGGLRELIHLLKYQKVRPAATVLGRMLAEAVNGLESSWTQRPGLIVPVPLHARKLRQRGFNQSELIVQSAIKHGVLARGNFRLAPGVMERLRETRSQTGLTRHQRRENLRGSFAVITPGEIVGREVLLVDDVFTTGTTVSECSRVLLRAGASKVVVATVARTMRIDAQGGDLAPGFIKDERHVGARIDEQISAAG